MKDNNYKYRLLVKIFLFAYLVFFGDFFAYGQGVFGGKIAILDNAGSTTSVSYTHLDVYKRQFLD